MGRRVYNQKGDFVWKYVFGAQPSEQFRIAEELGIGRYRNREEQNKSPRAKYGDVLMLSRKDIQTLEQTVKPMRPLLADFLHTEHRMLHPIGKTKCMGISGQDHESLMKTFKKRNEDILFHLMCYHYVKVGKTFFQKHPRSKTMNCFGEY